MKFLVAFVAVVAVAVASPINKPASDELAHIAAVMEAINSPSTDPATAILLEQQLGEILAALSPISVGPAIVDVPVSPISVGAPIVDIPVSPVGVGTPVLPPHDGGALTVPEPSQSVPYPFPTWETAPVQPSPVIIGEIPAGAPAPLVQVIINVNDQASPAVVPGAVSGPGVSGVSVATPVLPGPVNVVDNVGTPVSPISVAEPVVVSPISVAEPVAVSPISVAEPVVVSPISVAEPVAVSPISVAEPVVVSPISVAEPVAVSPVSVGTPVEVSPVSVGAPVEVSPVSVGAPIQVSPVSVGAPVAVNPIDIILN